MFTSETSEVKKYASAHFKRKKCTKKASNFVLSPLCVEKGLSVFQSYVRNKPVLFCDQLRKNKSKLLHIPAYIDITYILNSGNVNVIFYINYSYFLYNNMINSDFIGFFALIFPSSLTFIPVLGIS